MGDEFRSFVLKHIQTQNFVPFPNTARELLGRKNIYQPNISKLATHKNIKVRGE
jgi:hypothetical protein